METAVLVLVVLQTVKECTGLYSHYQRLHERDDDLQRAGLHVRIEIYRLDEHQWTISEGNGYWPPGLNSLCTDILNQMDKNVRMLKDLISRHTSNSIPRAAMRGMSWLASGMERLNELVTAVGKWNDRLDLFVPEHKRERSRYFIMSQSIASNSMQDLEDITKGTRERYPAISNNAAVRGLTLWSRGNSGVGFSSFPTYIMIIMPYAN